MTLVIYIGVVIAATVVVWKGSAVLESSSAALARHYRLPPVVEGSVIIAVGSSFPEISTTVISAVVHGEFDLGISVVVGSAIFNVLVIPGASGLAAKGLKTDRMVVYRDAQFYLISVAALLLAFSMAVIYHPVEEGRLVGEMTAPIALVPLLLYVLYLFLQQQETSDFQREERAEAPESISIGKQLGLLILSLALIVAGVEGLLRSAIFFGDYFGTPSFFWGVTVVAAATSIPDAFVSVRVAREGRGTVSIANVLGSNIVDLLVAIPLGVLVTRGATTVDYALAVPLMAYLTAATVLLFAFIRFRLDLTRVESAVLLVTYAVFVAWMLLEMLGLLSLIPD